MKWLAVFLAVALADALWSRYILAASTRQAGIASLYSAGIVLVGGFTTLAYVDDPRYLLPAALGAVAGTYWAVRRG
jgi:hypothetical protein